MQELVDVHVPEADMIRLVVDNLNTHTPAALYETFAPAEARRITRKLELHYTPKHGVVSLSCCDALHSILETDVRWYAVGQGTLRAPDTRATHPSSRHDRSGPLPSLGLGVAIYAAIQLHGSAPALVTVLASSCAVTRNGNTPTTTTVVSRTTLGPWRTRSCAV